VDFFKLNHIAWTKFHNGELHWTKRPITNISDGQFSVLFLEQTKKMKNRLKLNITVKAREWRVLMYKCIMKYNDRGVERHYETRIPEKLKYNNM
jgi:hypothetical protein